MAPRPTFPAPIAEAIWNLKYRLKEGARPLDADLDATWRRVARAAAGAEPGGRKVRQQWEDRFHTALADFGFLPAGRVLAGAGASRAVTLFNCFVMGPIEDDLSAIFEGVREAALTMQAGGGIGHDFSTLRPKGALVKSIGADASGPVSFMDVWDAMCRSIMSAGARRGAMMATLRCDHPDIEAFIDAKAEPGRLTNFNLSVLVTDAFMAAVRDDGDWDLVFDERVWRTVKARALWNRLMRATYETSEPGVIFIDRINAANNLAYCEDIRATNPCGEQPLPAYGACLLGSINLTAFVREPFAPAAVLDTVGVAERVATAVRMLDNIIDISRYPLTRQRQEAKAKRRIGLGVTGLADALAMCGLAYGSREAVARAGVWMAAIQQAAYRASALLAAEKGAFPLYDAAAFLARPNVARLDEETRGLIARHGVRNGCLTSIAPTGTISLLAGNVSSGVEPIFDYGARRRVLGADGATREELVEDFAHALFRRTAGAGAPLPAAFVRARELSPVQHLAMQAALQPHVDSSISKTINCPEDISFEAFKDVYERAYALGLKGCTTFRPSAVRGAVLVPADQSASAAPALPPRAAGAAAPVAMREDADVVYMAKPLERESALAGYTYKLKWPGSDHAIYVTINDIERDGRRRPFEVFINTRNLEHYAWTVALTRMISAVFRRGGDVSFVAEELKAVFDPQGGRWIGGRYVPSLLAAIGEVIEGHMRRTGFLAGEGSLQLLSEDGEEGAAQPGAHGQPPPKRRGRAAAGGGAAAPAARFCPRCAALELVREEGCWVCRSCGFSRCG